MGEGNHWRFFVMLVLQCLQAVITFFVVRFGVYVVFLVHVNVLV